MSRGLLFCELLRLARGPELNLAIVEETCLGKEAQIQRIGQSDVFQIGTWFEGRIVRAIDLGDKDEDQPITACMAQKRAQFSDGCKAVFRYEPPATATPVNYAPSAKPSKPLNLSPNKRG